MLGGSLLLVGLTPSHNKSSKYLINKYPERKVALIQYLNIIYMISSQAFRDGALETKNYLGRRRISISVQEINVLTENLP